MLVNPLRRSIFLTFLLFAAAPLFGFGQQTEADRTLSGTWVPLKQNKVMPNYKLTITHDVDVVLIAQEFDFEKQVVSNRLKLFIDGRGERNLVNFAGADAPVEITSKTTWKKGKLVRRYAHCYNTVIGAEHVQICNDHVETYSVSPDGQNLTLYNGMRNGSKLSSGERKFRKES